MPTVQLTRTLAKRSLSELVDLHAYWIGGEPPVQRRDLLSLIEERMTEPVAVSARRAALDKTLEPVFRTLLDAPGEALLFGRIKHAPHCNGVESRSIRSSLSELVHLGFAAQVKGNRAGESRNFWGVPEELFAALGHAVQDNGEPGALLSLRGWLEKRFRSMGQEETSDQARQMYRFLSGDEALLSRVDSLPIEAKECYEKIATEWGGIAPISELQKICTSMSLEEFLHVLEGSSLGTVGELDLESFGVRQRGQVVALFIEGVLAFLKREGQLTDIHPEQTASIGVDFVSNFARFASFVEGENVRFTVAGTLFKSTGKRIAERLIPNPGREFRKFDILETEYRFALSHRYIDRTGMRSFRVTQSGFDFLNEPLAVKQKQMLDWIVEDRDLPGDLAHQLPLRRTTLRYLKRLEPEVWYDAMFLPFVVRNHHLGSLSLKERPHGESRSFPVRSSADLKSLAWNLFTWIRKNLYLLGIVDLAYDDSGRAIGVRLTTMGAELLGMITGRELEATGRIVVNPDFEVVLFPDRRSHELVYELDRFCERELTDSLYHYRITPGSLHRALAEGERLDSIVSLLKERSRTPIPQNVLYSLESWARKDGLVIFEGHCLKSDSPEVLDRVSLHPELCAIGLSRQDSLTIKLAGSVSKESLAGWLRDYGLSLRVEAV